jgi:hypothetical protein
MTSAARICAVRAPNNTVAARIDAGGGEIGATVGEIGEPGNGRCQIAGGHQIAAEAAAEKGK